MRTTITQTFFAHPGDDVPQIVVYGDVETTCPNVTRAESE